MLLQDVRYAFRSLRRSPGFIVAAILTLALGIGANTAIFSVLEGVVLSPLPFRNPNQLVVMALYNRALKHPTDLSYPDFLDWQRNSRSFQDMAAFVSQGYDVTDPGAPEHVAGVEVSAGFFQTLGVKLALGREFTNGEDRHGGTPVAVISDRLWRERWGASRGALGTTVTLNGASYTIVGVLPGDFRFLNAPTDVYTPIGQGDPLQRTDRTIHDVICVARLQPQLGLGQAQAEMDTVQAHIDELNPATERGQGIYMGLLQGFIVGDVGGTLLLLLGAVGLVLLIACANVANLLLARSLARTREFAVRAALGASRSQIARQLITESGLLSLAGGALGLVMAQGGLPAVLAAAPGSLPRVQNIAVNAAVLGFALGVSIVVGILFGLLPAWKSSDTDLQTGLKEGGRGSMLGHQRTQRGLVIGQIALAVVLLTGGSLLLRTIRNLWAANPGFNTQHVLTFRAGLSPASRQAPEEIRNGYRQLMERVREIPGVQAADITALLPLTQSDNSGPFWIGPHQPASMAEIPRALYYWIGPDYFHTMQIPLLRGRMLSPDDTNRSEPVIVIDSVLARNYFGNRDPVGQTVTVAHWAVARVVGVVGHVRHLRLGGSNSLDEEPQIYASIYQLLDAWLPSFSKEVKIVVRTPLEAAALMPAIQDAVSGVAGGEPVYNVRSMQELVSGSIEPQRLAMILLVAFAALALVLACLGIYGVVAYSMTRRTQEIGIRIALGAARRDIARMVIGEGFRLALFGVGAGLVAALALTRVLSSFSRLLYGVGASDPLTFLAVPCILIAATIAACSIPARRAARLDPTVALRHE
jgi:predicted permease